MLTYGVAFSIGGSVHKRGFSYVYTQNLPTLFGQPDNIVALCAAKIERVTGRAALDEALQRVSWFATGFAALVLIAVFPELFWSFAFDFRFHEPSFRS